MPAHPLNMMGLDADVEMIEDIDKIALRQACPSVNYQPEIPNVTQSESSSQRLSQLSSTSKRTGKGKDVNVLVNVLRSKYPHPIFNYFWIGSAEQRSSRENLDNIPEQPQIELQQLNEEISNPIPSAE